MYKKFAILLEKNHKTSYQVAKETGVSTATLSSWKNGYYTPKADKLKILLITSALALSISWKSRR